MGKKNSKLCDTENIPHYRKKGILILHGIYYPSLNLMAQNQKLMSDISLRSFMDLYNFSIPMLSILYIVNFFLEDIFKNMTSTFFLRNLTLAKT